MFEAEVRATFAAQARAMADQFNQIKLDDYLGACRNWAIRANGPPPVVPLGFVAEVEFEPVFVLRIVGTETPVSDIKPESFLPKFATDTDAVGGPVGGPIPGALGKFYAAAGTNPQAGEDYRTGGFTYVYKRPTPFGGFWAKL